MHTIYIHMLVLITTVVTNTVLVFSDPIRRQHRRVAIINIIIIIFITITINASPLSSLQCPHSTQTSTSCCHSFHNHHHHYHHHHHYYHHHHHHYHHHHHSNTIPPSPVFCVPTRHQHRRVVVIYLEQNGDITVETANTHHLHHALTHPLTHIASLTNSHVHTHTHTHTFHLHHLRV